MTQADHEKGCKKVSVQTRVEEIKCETAEELWERLCPLKPLRRPPSKFIYRGHGNAEWPLLPKIFREENNPVKRFWGGRKVTYDDQVFAELEEIGVRSCNATLRER